MIAVIQRVAEASCTIDNQIHSRIDKGLLVLLGITHQDTEEDIDWLTKKIANLRIFNDKSGKMNLSLAEIEGEILLISQFTLYASTAKGNRPSFTEAARPEVAIPLYEKMILTLQKQTEKSVQTGKFGADMKINLLNDGPVTIIIDSKNKI
ncbi:MAG: D-tyrosyl-tRNA(Tyr) deacylase [Verrucomicrobia bacterium]|nr:D-tyrosyl-tRNA(Tyr) deacylase [Cytophagales bacterium]